MGSTPESIRYVCQQLQCRPEALTWGAGREVVVERGANKKLGFHFKTYQCGVEETVTLIVKVKPECRLPQGSLIATDRILSVNGLPVTGLSEAEVHHLLSHQHQPSIKLRVAAMSKADPSAQVKRFLSVNSGTSAGSGTASVDSAERPQVKRFAKSTSVETATPPSPLADTTPASPSSEQTRQPVEGGGPDIGSAARARQFAHLMSGTHSLPATMEDEIILQDIVLWEDEKTHSLPPVLSPHPLAPSPLPPNNMPRAASLTTTGIGGVGGVAEGGESTVGAVAATGNSLAVEVCRSPGCGLSNCLWHNFVLSNPQYIIWDPSTKTVVLDRNGSASFGFKYKVKKHDGPPGEVFALVTNVSSGGVAWNYLLPGDWIRSINGKPIDTAKEAFKFEFRSLPSLRLVLQRPAGLSQRAETTLRQLAKSMRIPLYIPPVQPLSPPSNPSPSSQKQSTSPSSRYATGQASPHTQVSQQGFVFRNARGVDGGDGRGAANVFSSSVSVVADPALDQYPRQAQSPGEHIPLATLMRCSPQRGASSSDKYPLPRARVVVCGSHTSATEFVRGLVSDSGVVVDAEAHTQCFQLSMKYTEESRIQIHTWPQPLASLIRESVPGSPGVHSTGSAGQVYLNLELYVISDENFFHHCAAWLLPSASVILLTFDAQKLLNQPEPETSRLAAMVHTVRTSSTHTAVNTTPAVILYGVQSGADSNIAAEEVQAIFYVTRFGHQLLDHYALSIPEVSQPTSPASMETARYFLFEACFTHCQQTLVHPSIAGVLDTLMTCQDLQLNSTKLAAMLGKVAGDEYPDSVHRLVHELLSTGCIVEPTGSSRANGAPSEQKYLLPFNVFQSLSKLFIKSDLDSHSPECRQTWFKLLTLGRVSQTELGSILASDSLNCENVSVDFLEGIGVVFTLHSSAGMLSDSGFAEEPIEYIVPYFLIDLQPQEDAQGGDLGGQQFVLTFPRGLSWQMYFRTLSAMSTLPTTEAVDPQGLYTCDVKHNGVRLSLHLRKNSDSIHICAKRCDRKCREAVTVQQLERLFGCVMPPGLQFNLCTAESVDPNSGLLSGREAVSQHQIPVGRNPETTQKTSPKQCGATAKKRNATDARLSSLPWSVFKSLATRLSIPTPTSADWRTVAEKAGKSFEEICAYEQLQTGELPALSFLREWMMTATVQQLLDILEELERPDVRDIILEHCQ